MELEVYFEPIGHDVYQSGFDRHMPLLGDLIDYYQDEHSFPDLSDVKIAVLGVKEDRNSIHNEGCANAPDLVRKALYNLYPVDSTLKIADLGNIKRGYDVSDTYFAVSNVLSELIKNNIIPIVLGGSQDLTYANYLAYEGLGQIINMVQVDSSFDLGTTDDELSSETYLSKIITHQPNILFNYTNLGYQSYYVDPKSVLLMRNLYFDVYRLGNVRADIEEVEPVVRNADMVSFDVSCIKSADAPGSATASPNGFYGEEACQIVRYAGLSDKLTSIGFYELNPQFDRNGQTAKLVSQMIWYFIDGFCNRKHDFPHKHKHEYLKYVVSIKDHQHDIVFYKSKKSERWWMEAPCPSNLKLKYERHYIVPCSYADYLVACKDDIPDRWWQVYQKIM